MADTIISGANVTGAYAFEDSKAYLQKANKLDHLASDETYNAFGRGVDISVSRNQNKERVFGIGSRTAQATATKDFSGTITVNGIVSSPYWFLGILGSVETTPDDKVYNHTYTETDCLPSLTVKRTMDFGDTEGTEVFYGAVINQGTLTASVGEEVRFSLEMPYRFDDLDTTTAISEVVDNEEIFTFAGGSINLAGSELALVQNFEMTFNNNTDIVKGIGSRFGEAISPKTREYNFRYTISITDYATLQAFRDINQKADLVLEFVNCAGDKLISTFSQVHINEDTLNTSISDIVKEDVTGWAHECTSVVYTNTSATAPKQAENIE